MVINPEIQVFCKAMGCRIVRLREDQQT